MISTDYTWLQASWTLKKDVIWLMDAVKIDSWNFLKKPEVNRGISLLHHRL